MKWGSYSSDKTIPTCAVKTAQPDLKSSVNQFAGDGASPVATAERKAIRKTIT